MKGLGIFLVIAGIAWALIAFNMDTSVSTGFGSVNNIGLIATRSNNLMFAGLTILIGVVLIGFGSLSKRAGAHDASYGLMPCPFCAELVKPEAAVCKHCGRGITAAAAERAQHTAQIKAEAVASARTAQIAAKREQLFALCDSLKAAPLNHGQYLQLAQAAGGSFVLITSLFSTRYGVTLDGSQVTFKDLKALLPWFLENIVPRIENEG